MKLVKELISSEQVKQLEDKLEWQKKKIDFLSKQVFEQIEYTQFVSNQLSDLHLLIMRNAYYQAGGFMNLQFNPEDVTNIVHRKKES